MGGGKVEGMGGGEVGTEIGIYNEKKKEKCCFSPQTAVCIWNSI